MVKLKISDEEFDQMERESRHAEMVEALREARTGELTKLVQESNVMLRLLSRKDFSTDVRPLAEALASTMKELVKELKEMKRADPPNRFRIDRDKNGLIERVVVEK